MKTFIILLLSITGTYMVSAQSKKKIDLTQRLALEETVPDLPPMPILNFESPTVDINDYANKVVILYFWDTYCASCIALMPHIKKLQTEMGDRAQILTVTWQPKEVIEQFFKKNKYLEENNTYLPTIVGDTLLKKYFPYQASSLTVFLYKGKLKAITHSDYLKRNYIEELIVSDKLDIPFRDDFNERVVLRDTADGNVMGKVLITGHQEGLIFKGGLPIERDSITGDFITYINNSGILSAYQRLYAQIEKPRFVWHPDRIVWKVKDKNRYSPGLDDKDVNIWSRKNDICYQRISRDTLRKAEMAKLIIQDLNFFLGLNVYRTKEKKDVIVIQKTDRSRGEAVKVPDENAIPIEGAANVAFFSLDMTYKYPPAIDESGYIGMINVGKFANIEELSAQLLYYGLEAVKTKRMIDVLLVEEVR